MRHDEHYVEALAASAGDPVGRIVPIELLDPNPNQPRQVMGDLSELMASVAEKGIIEPLIVRQRGARYQIIAGERRYHAAVQVGLREVPVIIREVDDAEVMELALVENLQRKDLTAFEESEALHQLAHRCNYTHEDMARKLGKSRTSITESLSLANMPDEVRNLCRLADITSKSTLLQIVRQADQQKMIALVERHCDTRGCASRDSKAKSRPAQVLRLRVQATNQVLRPAPQLQEVARREGRDHLGARKHHQRTARQPLSHQGHQVLATKGTENTKAGDRQRNPLVLSFVAQTPCSSWLRFT
jgi:ParB family chromosome partitioning protein